MKKITAKTPRGAAQKFYRWLCNYAKELGWNTQYIYLWSPEEANARGWGNGWTVCWEEGPYEWAISLCGGSSIYHSEFPMSKADEPEVDLDGGMFWFAEAYNNFILSFYAN